MSATLAVAVVTTLSFTACKRDAAPVTPETGMNADGSSKGLPQPAASGSRSSITGTPTDNGYMNLPPVTRIPGGTGNGVSGTAQPPAVVQALPPVPTTTTPAPPTTSGPVAAVIDANDAREPTVDDAKRLIEDYYAAVNRGAYDSAYRMWSNNGQASGKTLRDFTNGYADTASVSVSLGDPGRVDAGAGQRYIVLPVRIVARQRDQSTKEFQGSYTLGRTVVDGATSAQRNWSIRSASIDTVRP
ncbi:hypothetical protein [Lysobacter soyae]|uniref:Lipoprotein n=1 Tax=Lysobacter soyae TaxID=2764185 RepID=A0ABX8WPJ0_9GAMM|nr:hypothetical protein [Lysobacter sp. CJ11]QYR52579.1 hypothetical protein H8L67_08270 [Lysobacter sp. CJ11]